MLIFVFFNRLILPYSWYTPWWRFLESVLSAIILTSLLYHLLSLTKLWMTTSTLHLAPEHFQTLGLSNCMCIIYVQYNLCNLNYFIYILAYIKVKSPDTSSIIVTPPAVTSTPINWTTNKWNNPQFQISPGKTKLYK